LSNWKYSVIAYRYDKSIGYNFLKINQFLTKL
jgi:hypothetical protein